MTEEKEAIYIDGVDVAGCKYLNKVVNEEPYCNIDEEHLYTCSSDENCYYKQLKRLEQENKELKEVKEQLKKWNDENLKRQGEMQLWIDLAEEQRKKYRSALEEIREIEELAYYSKGISEEPLSQRDFMIDAINNYEQRRIKILTKINEVINESN